MRSPVSAYSDRIVHLFQRESSTLKFPVRSEAAKKDDAILLERHPSIRIDCCRRLRCTQLFTYSQLSHRRAK